MIIKWLPVVIAGLVATAGLAESPIAQPNKPIKDLIDPNLLAKRKVVEDGKNAYLKIKDIAAKNEKQKDVLWTNEVTPTKSLAKYSKSDIDRLLEYRKMTMDSRTKLMALASAPCLVPDSNAMLVDNITSVQDTILFGLTADVVAIREEKMSSGDAAKLLAEHIRLAKMYLDCEGSLVQTVVAVSYLGEIAEYLRQLAELGVLDPAGTKALVSEAAQIIPDERFLAEQIRRMYQYEYVWAVKEVQSDVARSEIKPPEKVFSPSATIAAINDHFRLLLRVLARGELFTIPAENLNGLQRYAKIPPEVESDLHELRQHMFDKASDKETKERIARSLASLRDNTRDMDNLLGRLMLQMIHHDPDLKMKSVMTDILHAKGDLAAALFLTSGKKVELIKITQSSPGNVLAQNDLSPHRLSYSADRLALEWTVKDRPDLTVTIPLHKR